MQNIINYLNYFHLKRIYNFIKCKKYTIDTIIDIGSYEGYFAQLFVNNKSIKNIYCFEPQIDKFNYLIKKFRNKKKVKVFNCAVSNKLGIQKFYVNKIKSTSSLIKDSNFNYFFDFIKKLFSFHIPSHTQKINVRCITLKSFLQKKRGGGEFLVKIDTEGYEHKVMRGAADQIKKIDYIILEKHFFRKDFLNLKKFTIIKKFNLFIFQDILVKNNHSTKLK
jgi:FkbM family methyltransferase